LVEFRLESKGVDIDTSGGDVGVVLVGLDKIEVRSKTFLETIVTVKEETSTDDRVTTSIAGTKTSMVSTIASSGEGVSASEVNEVSGTSGAGTNTIALDEASSVGISGGGTIEVRSSTKTFRDTKGSNRGGVGTVLDIGVGEGLGHVTSLDIGVKEVEGKGGKVGEGLAVNVGTIVGN
jgi:hypothetical protein